ncbi:hypothetical protein F7725_006441, partial [Dissostichus mawsoni]
LAANSNPHNKYDRSLRGVGLSGHLFPAQYGGDADAEEPRSSVALLELIVYRHLQHCVDLFVGLLLLFLAGLQQAEAAAESAEMSNLNWKPFIYGGMASIVQGQSQYTEIRYRGMFHALFKIGKEEGLKALYSGISPALLRQASYGTIKIGTYNSLKRLFVTHPEDETMIINVFCGVVSGVLSSSLANPTDVLKGVIPTAQRAAIVVGVELPVYDITKKHLLKSGAMGDTILTHFMYRVSSGAPMYKGTLDGLMLTWKNEGFFALYKGFWPNWLRLGPWNIIFFITFEQLKTLPKWDWLCLDCVWQKCEHGSTCRLTTLPAKHTNDTVQHYSSAHQTLIQISCSVFAMCLIYSHWFCFCTVFKECDLSLSSSFDTPQAAKSWL